MGLRVIGVIYRQARIIAQAPRTGNAGEDMDPRSRPTPGRRRTSMPRPSRIQEALMTTEPDPADVRVLPDLPAACAALAAALAGLVRHNPRRQPALHSGPLRRQYAPPALRAARRRVPHGPPLGASALLLGRRPSRRARRPPQQLPHGPRDPPRPHPPSLWTTSIRCRRSSTTPRRRRRSTRPPCARTSVGPGRAST